MDGFSDGNSDPIDFSKVVSLVQDIATEIFHEDCKSQGVRTESDVRSKRLSDNVMAEIMLFQYLVRLLETDFICCCQVFKGNKGWPIIRDSFLNQLLGSQRTNLKKLNYIISSHYGCNRQGVDWSISSGIDRTQVENGHYFDLSFEVFLTVYH